MFFFSFGVEKQEKEKKIKEEKEKLFCVTK
jgi:hypothetical protein